MASIRPFRALRPKSEFVEKVASVPYDVISVPEARKLAEGNDLSFLHVIRPEIDLPVGTDEHDDAVYAQGAENLRAFAENGTFETDEKPSLYVYRLVMDGREQVGIFGLVSAADYDEGRIMKHENTRPDKEEDRTRHIQAQHAHAEPVMLTYRAVDSVDDVVAKAMEQDPLYDFEAKDFVRHTIWNLEAPEDVVHAFEEDVERLYVADGHHRCAAAGRAAKQNPDNEDAQYFTAVMFPIEEMEIMPYHRVIKKLPVGRRKFLDQLRHRFEIEEVYVPEPDAPGIVTVYLGEELGWHAFELPETNREGVAATLDVALLGEFVLEPMLNITDPRTDPNIAFVGGIRGTEELERLVNIGEAEVALAMFPTGPEELLEVSDAGELMPPKSTWFEPKLRSGLLVHTF